MSVSNRFSLRGRLSLGSELVAGVVVVEGARIIEVLRGNSEDIPWPIHDAPIIAPGYIDMQVNGGFGVEVDDDPQSYRVLAQRLPERGITSYLPTAVTSPDEFYTSLLTAHRAAAGFTGARSLGLHLEGPFLSPERKGAHRLDIIQAAGPQAVDRLIDSGDVRLVTLAPERPGALGAIRHLRAQGVLVALGHTNATYEEFVRGIDAGASLTTHLFNAMAPFGHRNPGPIGATLTDDRVVAGLIADGIHAHPAAIQLAIRAKGLDRIILVSDMTAATGMPPGKYSLGGREVQTDGITVRLPMGTLAGAMATVDECVRNVVQWTGVSTAQVLRLASEVPAGLLGLRNKGKILPGFDADLILLDDALNVQSTFVSGRQVFTANER